MTKRIHIGPLNGNMTLRITPTGYDASDIASPCVFSSDGEYLTVHTVIDAVLNRDNNYHWGAYTFPTLGYCPLAFPSITHTTLNRVFYPNDRNPATDAMNNFWEWGVQDGKVWAGTNTANSYGGNFRFRCLIFKNRADRFTSA